MDVVHYLVKSKNPHHGEAIARGWGARTVPAEGRRLVDADLHLIGGLDHGSLDLLQQAREQCKPYVFFDRAYFGGGPGTDKLRAVKNAYQKTKIDDIAPERDPAHPVPELRPWRQGGRQVLVVPPSDAIVRLFGLGRVWDTVNDWLPSLTDRPFRISRKGDPEPLAARLRDCWCVVTFTSTVAIEAVCAGVPVFVSDESAARPMGNSLYALQEYIEEPAMPVGRERWAASLLAGQFTLDEIANGIARKRIDA